VIAAGRRLHAALFTWPDARGWKLLFAGPIG